MLLEPNAASDHILESREGMREAGRHHRQEKPEQEPLLCLVVPNNVIGKEGPRRVSAPSCLTGSTQGGDNDLSAPIVTPQEEMRPLQTVGSMLRPLANSVF